MVVENLDVSPDAHCGAGGVLGHRSRPQNHYFGRRDTRNAAQDDSLTMIGIAEVLGGDEQHGAARNLAHGPYDG